jgi:hypothetical protein
MFKIIYTPTNETRSEHSTIESVNAALQVFETTPSTHRVEEFPDPPIDESSIIEELDLESI